MKEDETIISSIEVGEMIETAMRQGRRARRAGYTHLEGPYNPSHRLHEWWLKGWADAGLGTDAEWAGDRRKRTGVE